MIAPATVLAALMVFLTATAQAEDAHKCEPWPACSIVTSPLIPGAPTPGLRLQDKANPGALTGQRINRDTYRLPIPLGVETATGLQAPRVKSARGGYRRYLPPGGHLRLRSEPQPCRQFAHDPVPEQQHAEEPE